MRVTPVFVSLTCLLVFAQNSAASAQTADSEIPAAEEARNAAQEHFRLGQEAYDETRYGDAAREFQQAYDLSGRAELLYNIGIAHERLLNWQATIDAFEMYLGRVPHADNRQNVQARLVLARERLEEEEGNLSTTSRGTSNTAPVALLVGGGVLAIGGGVLLGLGASTIGDVESSAPGTRQWSEAEQDVSRGNTLRTSGVIALSVGVVVLVAGLAWLLGRKSPEDSAWVGNGVRF